MKTWRRFAACYTIGTKREVVCGDILPQDRDEIAQMQSVSSLTAISVEMHEFQRQKCIHHGMPEEGKVETFQMYE